MRAVHLCSFVEGIYDARSPSGKQGITFEDSDRFGPSKLNLKTGEPSPISERLRWFWDWYPRWRDAGRPTNGERSTPYGNVQIARGEVMTDDQIKHMTERFLGWKLPENFNPDAGISFKAEFNEHTDYPMRHEPSGTNLFDYTQAEQMVRHMLKGLPS